MGKECRKATKLYAKFLKAVKLHNLEALTDLIDPVEQLFELILDKEPCRDLCIKPICSTLCRSSCGSSVYIVPQPVDIYTCGVKCCICGCAKCTCLRRC